MLEEDLSLRNPIFQQLHWKGGIPSTMTEVLPAAGVEVISSSGADTKDGSVGGFEDDSNGSTASGKPAAPPDKPV